MTTCNTPFRSPKRTILQGRALHRSIHHNMIKDLSFQALRFPGKAVAERDSLTIGITQFPSTLNPNIEMMAAKSYVLGMALRPFTVYDADWQLVCLLCV